MQEIVSRKEAAQRGLEWYFTGKPCRNGGIAKRSMAYACLCDQCREMRRQKAAKEYSKNPDKFIRATREWQERNKQSVSIASKEYRERPGRKEIAAASKKRYYEKNKQKEKDAASKYYRENLDYCLARKKKWYDENVDEILRKARDYQKANPHVFSVYVSQRHAARIQRIPRWYGEFDDFVIKEASHLRHIRSLPTGMKWAVDHVIPMRGRSVSGLHCGLNIQVIPSALNGSKGNRMVMLDPFEWISYLK